MGIIINICYLILVALPSNFIEINKHQRSVVDIDPTFKSVVDKFMG